MRSMNPLKKGSDPIFVGELALFGVRSRPSPGEPVSTRPVRRVRVSRSAAPRLRPVTCGGARASWAFMDNDAKKTALRMIPYGLYVLTAEDGEGNVAAATVNWVTQTAFEPPLIAVGVKVESGAHALIKSTGAFALNVLGKGQQGQAYAFFKPVERDGDTLGGERCHTGTTGAPILDNAPAFVECKLVDTIEKGDHSLFVGEVVNAGVTKQPEGRADDATLWLKDLGEKVFYGG